MKGFVNVPQASKILKNLDEAPDIKTFTLSFEGWREVQPGQFMELYVKGYWEIPISVAAVSEGAVHLTIARVGRVTSALFRHREGECVGLRGPYGRPWPMDLLQGHRVLLVIGGLGLAPVRMVIEELAGPQITLVYGARSPDLLLYRYRYPEWQQRGMTLLLTVDRGDASWQGPVGVVTTLLNASLVQRHDYALVAGPPIMMKFATQQLEELGMARERVFVTLENHMKCGVGLCGHCRIGDKYVCVDGPVFRLDEVRNLETWAAGEVL